MKEEEIDLLTIGEIVAKDFRAASVFREAGIDFCCGGKKGFSETCSEKGINASGLKEELKKLGSVPNTTTHNYNEWEPVFLCDFIVNTHHKYVLRTMPDLVQYTSKISEVHEDRHPELKQVAELFSEINRELLQHLRNEEEVFFPAIREFMSTGSQKSKGTILSEITRLSEEHEFAGGAMDKINVLTDKYRLPPDSCNTYNLTFKLLEQFEDDLHVHVHLENNILFPGILKSVN
ncbi:MAG: iron-sulfur cluster repair di-iron protein [Bacteroidetes bacterium GWA2_40_15]|nr:MAG: iron-sulfur cluster repair di-iron protein [Bacteroidetes bacterium GWA2_40_15]OFX94539.1 MAG: iron-sulfur cluster repair di-iron protein [Bacteroidetes bacterium GWC2_40_22]HBH85357.1 iron-sulfur cluster repair di-iron protein [Bacteroidales bacterium]HBQ81486.1 iron-sulfur cluster repair di-iron protein [Bacteroidales bacterium]